MQKKCQQYNCDGVSVIELCEISQCANYVKLIVFIVLHYNLRMVIYFQCKYMYFICFVRFLVSPHVYSSPLFASKLYSTSYICIYSHTRIQDVYNIAYLKDEILKKIVTNNGIYKCV